MIFFRARPPATWVGYVVAVLAFGAISPVIGVTPRLLLRGFPLLGVVGAKLPPLWFEVVLGLSRPVHGRARDDGHGRAALDAVTSPSGRTGPGGPGDAGPRRPGGPDPRTRPPSTRWIVVDVASWRVASVGWLARPWCLVTYTWHRTSSTSPSTCWVPTTWSTAGSTPSRCPFTPYLPFTYPPIAALAFLPLALLPRQAAQLVWAAVNVASLYAVIVLSLRAVRARHRPGAARSCGRAGAARSGLLLEPVRLTFYFGQINLVLCAADPGRPDPTVLRSGDRTLPRGVLVGISRGRQAGPTGVRPLPVRHPPGPGGLDRPRRLRRRARSWPWRSTRR